MNDGIEYARLIGIPTSSCEYVKSKKRLGIFKKKSIIKKVNDELSCDDCSISENTLTDFKKLSAQSSENPIGKTTPTTDCLTVNGDLVKAKRKTSGKTDCVGCDSCDNENNEKSESTESLLGKVVKVQTITAFLLVIAILVTNIIWENSGMNRLLRSVFGNTSIEDKIADERVYSDFSLNLPVKSDGVSLVKGVIEVNGEYSVYPVCEGVIDRVEKTQDGKYSITVKHSENFSSVIEGADLVYFSKGDAVNKNLPICHTKDKAQVYLYENGTLLTDYVAVENSIVFDK